MKKNMTRRVLKDACSSVSLAACAISVSISASAQSASSITIADIFVPASNWALSSEDSYALVRAGCLETLTTTNFEMELVPGLAESWRQVEPTVWEFVIREAKFQNGEDVTAHTVAAALNHLLKSEMPARSFKSDQVASVEVVDDRTVRITTINEDALFPYAVGTPFTGILAPSAYESGGTINILGTCTGPYEIIENAGTQGLRMKRNENYWGDQPSIENVNLIFIPDANARSTMIRSGEVDIAKELPLTALSQLDASTNITTLTTPVLRTTALIFNNKKGELANSSVREALSLVIDPDTISAAIFDSKFPPAVGPFSPNTPWAPANSAPRTSDLDRAKSLLSEAGVDPASLSLEIIAYNERPQFKDIAAVIQQQLAELGVTVTIRTGDWAAVETDLLAGNYDMTLMSRGYVFEYADPIGYFNFDFVCGGSFNLAHYCNEEFDAMVMKAARTADSTERAAIYQELADRIQTETIHHFLVHESTIDAHVNNLTGYQVDPLQLRYLNPDMRLQ